LLHPDEFLADDWLHGFILRDYVRINQDNKSKFRTSFSHGATLRTTVLLGGSNLYQPLDLKFSHWHLFEPKLAITSEADASCASLLKCAKSGYWNLSTVVREPAFEQSELETAKNQWKNFYRENLSSPSGVAQNTLGNVIYQVSDTFFQKTLEDQAADLEKMTREDLVGFS
jgi:hypothetical protein